MITDYFGAKIHNSLQLASLLSVKIIKPANERNGQKVLNKRVTKQPENSWIKVKRSELLQQMELLVSFLSNASML